MPNCFWAPPTGVPVLKRAYCASIWPLGPTRRGGAACFCVWGYSDYDKQGVADAYKRLEFRPFDQAWLAAMKPKWFDHWIGGGLEPEKKFLDARRSGLRRRGEAGRRFLGDAASQPPLPDQDARRSL